MVSVIHQLCTSDDQTKVHLALVSLILGGGILLINSFQLWCLRRIGSSQNAYTYLPFLYSLTLSDLVVGLGMVSNSSGRIILMKEDENLCRGFGSFFGLVLGRGSAFISLCTIVVFTVVKMMRVTCNVYISHAILKKVCVIIWIVGYVISGTSAFVDKDHTSTKKIIFGFCFVVLALCVIIVSYTIVYFKVRQSELEIGQFRFTGPPGNRHHQRNQHQNKFKWISLLHIASIIATVVPYSIYNLIALTMDVEQEQTLFKVKFVLMELMACNSLVDPIGFFILFRPCQRATSSRHATTFHMRRGRIHPSLVDSRLAKGIDDLQLQASSTSPVRSVDISQN